MVDDVEQKDVAQAGLISQPVATIENNIFVIYGNKHPAHGFTISNDKIRKILVHESFFQRLPSMTLELNDVGTYFHSVGFQIGNSIFVSVTPSLDSGIDVKPYIDAEFIIESIEYALDQDNNSYYYILKCTLAAEKYLNDIFVWPKDDSGTMLNRSKAFTSTEVLRACISHAGLKFTSSVDSNDTMPWLNASLCHADFADKIVSHAWISDDDMPLLYIDKNGLATYTSINKLCEGATVSNFIQVTTYQKLHDETKGTEENAKPTPYKAYESLRYVNAGFIQNQGGYGIKAKIFNPYNIEQINPIKFPVMVTKNLFTGKMPSLNETCFREKEFHDTGKDDKMRLGKISNKSQTQLENIRYNTVAFHFDGTHEYYDYAPMHHESIKRSFYQQFVFMTIDTVNQPFVDPKGEAIIRLGQRISIDPATVNNQQTIAAGDYIVAGLTHTFYTSSKYTIMATCVSDGINGVSEIKQSKNTQ